MSRTSRGRTVWCCLALSLLAIPSARALPLSPLRWVSNLDERCYLPLSSPPPLGIPVNLTFLDPVLVGLQAGAVTLTTLAPWAASAWTRSSP